MKLAPDGYWCVPLPWLVERVQFYSKWEIALQHIGCIWFECVHWSGTGLVIIALTSWETSALVSITTVWFFPWTVCKCSLVSSLALYIFNILFYFICTWTYGQMPTGQRTTLRTWYSPATLWGSRTRTQAFRAEHVSLSMNSPEGTIFPT